MKTRPGPSKLPPRAALVPGIVAFLLIAGGVFGLLFVWHRSRLGRAQDTEPVPTRTPSRSTGTDQQTFVYDEDVLLEPGYTYACRRVLRALIADSPSTAAVEDLVELWADPERSLVVVERGPIEVLERTKSPVDGSIWYQVRIPEDCLVKRRDTDAVDAWVEGIQLIGATFEMWTPLR